MRLCFGCIGAGSSKLLSVKKAVITIIIFVLVLVGLPAGLYVYFTYYAGGPYGSSLAEKLAGVPVYPGAEQITTPSRGGDTGQEISIIYRIDPNTPISDVREFYVNKLTEMGWELKPGESQFTYESDFTREVGESFDLYRPTFTKGRDAIVVNLECMRDENSWITPYNAETCAEVDEDTFLGVQIFYLDWLPPNFR